MDTWKDDIATICSAENNNKKKRIYIKMYIEFIHFGRFLKLKHKRPAAGP